MHKQNRKLIIFIFTLLATAALSAAVVTRSETIENSSVSSNVPYSLHYEEFQKNTVDLFKSLNLSDYGDMYLFVGYGFADKKEQNCYFVDNAKNKNILTDFDKPIVKEKKSYLLSRSRMTYDDCKSLANKYIGFVVDPMNATEDATIKSLYNDKDYWIGISKNNCGEHWQNQYNFEQSFNRITNKRCDQNQLNIFSVINSYSWKEESKNKHHYCLLQIDSKDYLRPIKVCAPWWQIEQTYPFKTTTVTNNLAPFFNIIAPKNVSACVDINSSTPIDYQALYNDKSKWVKYDCTSYYSVKAGDSCMENLLQDQCKVDECAGRVKEQCTLQSTFSSKIKDYEIGTVTKPDGTFKTIKTKDKIKTSEYLCPPPRPSIADCKEYVNVTIMPTDQCQPGGCDAYFSCLNQHPNNINACNALSSKCERHYGTDFEIDYKNKKILYARVKCSDDRMIENHNIDMVSRNKSQCTSYSTTTKYTTKDETCTADKPKQKFSVTAALTEPDIYMGKDNCVRINNDGSNVKNNYQLSFNASEYFNTKISKVSNSLKPGDISGTMVDPEKIVEVLQDGKVQITKKGDGTTASIETLDDLSKAFASVDSIVVGSDKESAALADISFFSTDNNKSAAINKYAKYTDAKFVSGSQAGDGTLTITQKEPSYKYFTKRWFEKRILVFDDDALSSITRPYSAFAQCLNIPLDAVKSKYGAPSPIYNGKGPKVSPTVVRESYENSKYMESYSDSDVMSKGLYCKRENNAKDIDWFGTKSPDLYFNTYSCSRLYGKTGEVWVVPDQKRFYSSHQSLQLQSGNGGSVEHTGTVRDYTSSGKYYKDKTYKYYEYTCPSGYTPKDKGYTTYSRTDNDILNQDTSGVLSAAVNSSVPPAGNCVADEATTSEITKNSAKELPLVKYDEINSRYCKRVTSIITGTTSDYADYNCSKYLNSAGDWAYNKKTYYMYNADGYKYFRQKFCGNGDYNKNQVDKDGKNAQMLSFTSDEDFASLLKTDTSTLAYVDQLHDENNETFKIPQSKLDIDGVSREPIVKKLIDTSLEPMDSKFEVFRKDNKLYVISVRAMSSSDCAKYASDFNLTGHDVETEKKSGKCIIKYDYFDIDAVPSIPFTPLHAKFTRGNFDFTQTGFNSLLAVESYINGPWGYSTNYVSPPFVDGNVSINNKLIYPLLRESKDLTVDAEVQLDRTFLQKTITTRKKIIPEPASFVASGVAALGAGTATYLSGMAFAGPIAVLGDVGIEAVTYVINLFGGRKKYAYEERTTSLYMDKNKYRYYPNIYGYDKRINLEDEEKLQVYSSAFASGTHKKNKEAKILSKYAAQNKNLLVSTYGLDEDSYDNAMEDADAGIASGWPGLKWYQNGPRTRKENYTYTDSVKKTYNSVFYGATNQLTIFLPFKADYEIMAISEKGNILGKRIIYAENYIQTSSEQDHQQVFFGLDKNFNIASGLDYGKTDKACLYSNVLEWGGGVSGGYYSFGTPRGYTCQKSNDKYVKEHSARFIAVRKVGDNNFDIIKLQKPMPYANKIFVTTLGKLETRDYMCYDDVNCTIQ